jgi:hypothetical protein
MTPTHHITKARMGQYPNKAMDNSKKLIEMAEKKLTLILWLKSIFTWSKCFTAFNPYKKEIRRNTPKVKNSMASYTGFGNQCRW